MRHSQRALSCNFLSTVVLNKLAKIFHFCTCYKGDSTEQHTQRARFLSVLYHETCTTHTHTHTHTHTRARARADDAVGNGCSQHEATNLQKSYKSLLYTCTLSDSQSGISRNFLQTSANHSHPLPSRPSVTEILLRRNEFQRRRWRKWEEGKLLERNASRT